MSSIVSGFEYDIFISYRQKDNRADQWVTNFVKSLREELDATFKEEVSIYFDENPHDGLLETHDVDGSLKEKVKCLVFIPIVSQTYCDPNSFAWQKEFLAFTDFAKSDEFGLDIKLTNGNVVKRILPIRIHELDNTDKELYEEVTGGVMRPVDFIYKAGGINRPLSAKDDAIIRNPGQAFYRDNINKVANAIKEIFSGIVHKGDSRVSEKQQKESRERGSYQQLKDELIRRNVIRVGVVYLIVSVIMLQLVSILISMFGVAENLFTVAISILAILFPVSLVMAWFYERSPSGFVRYGTLQADANPFTPYQRKPLTGDFSILVLIIITFSLYFLIPKSKQSNASIESVTPLKLSLILEHEPNNVAISNDGLKIVYTINGPGNPMYLRNLNEEFSRPLASTEGGTSPFFSPDDKMVGYFNGESLFRTSIERSNPVKILDSNFGNAYWANPDTIFLSTELGTKLAKVSVTDGKSVGVQIPGNNFFNPSPIPGTEYLLGQDENSNIIVLSHRNGNYKIILHNGGWQPKYLEPGYLLYARQGRLLAAPFDKFTLKVTGASAPVISKVRTLGLSYNANYDVSKNGSMVYSSATPNDLVNLVWVNERGEVIDSLNLPTNYYGSFSLSPDGTKLAYGFNGPDSDIWIYDLESNRNQKLTDDGVNQTPIWSPDGLWVTYSSYLDGKWDIYRQNLNSTQQREKLTTTGILKRPGTWSPDSKLLTFYEVVEGKGDDIFLLSQDDKKITTPWQNTNFMDRQPRFSPDGKFVCYQSSQPGANFTYVEPFPATGERWQISSGVDAIWSPSGDKVFYRTLENSFHFVELSYEKGFSASPPKKMFSGPYIDVLDKSFDVSKDGKKFLVMKAVNVNERTNHFEVILNFPEELKKIIKNAQ